MCKKKRKSRTKKKTNNETIARNVPAHFFSSEYGYMHTSDLLLEPYCLYSTNFNQFNQQKKMENSNNNTNRILSLMRQSILRINSVIVFVYPILFFLQFYFSILFSPLLISIDHFHLDSFFFFFSSVLNHFTHMRMFPESFSIFQVLNRFIKKTK